MRRIFLSYRRDDSRDVTGRIHDRLAASFRRGSIFKDVDSIPYGSDFRAAIQAAVAHADVFLAIIGPSWLVRRLDEPDDLVRIEVAAALDRKMIVIPVLVAGAKLPEPEELPDDIRALAGHQAATVRADPDFNRDMDLLIARIRPLRVWRWAASAVALSLGIALTVKVVNVWTGDLRCERLRLSSERLDRALAVYELAATTLRDSFDVNLPLILDGNRDAEALTASRIVDYNKAYGRIRTDRTALTGPVEDDAPELKRKIEGLFDLALDRVHPLGVLALNPLRTRIERYATSPRQGPAAEVEHEAILGSVKDILAESAPDLSAFHAGLADLRQSSGCHR